MERPTHPVGPDAAIRELLSEGPLLPTPPMQHAPMPTQSLAPAGWLQAIARLFTPDRNEASLESPP